MLNKYSFINNKGHGDWSGLAWLFLFSCLAVLFIEGGLIAITILWWKYIVARIVFGILSIAGAVFIARTAIDLWD